MKVRGVILLAILALTGCAPSVPTPGQSRLERARILIEREEYAEAVEVLNAAIAEREDPDLYAERALAKEGLGETEGAEADYTAALEIDGQHFRSLNDRAAIRARGRRYAEAVDDLTRAIAVQPSADLPYANRAQAAIDSGDAEAALVDLEAVERLSPGQALTSLRTGDALLMLGKNEDALRAYDEAVRRDATSAAAVRQQARVLRKLGRFEDSADAMARAVALQPALAESEESGQIETAKEVAAALRAVGQTLRSEGDGWVAESDGGVRPVIIAADFDGRAVIDADEVQVLRDRGGFIALPSREGYRVVSAADFDLSGLPPASFFVETPVETQAETPPPLSE